MARIQVNLSTPTPKRGGKRDTVLVAIKVSELVEKVGADAVVMVGRKHLGRLLAKSLGS